MPQHNLPAEPNRFIGRDRDVDELCGLIAGERLVTLSGVGGIGKTRLALHVAALVAEEFPDGVWLMELARLTRPELVVQEVAKILGVRDEGSRELLDGLRSRMRGSRMLVILDNCEHLVETCADLAADLLTACPEVRILATSREPLRISRELIWRVPTLDLPGAADADVAAAESVQLFLDRAHAAGARLGTDPADLRAVAELCRALDGLPLALELAAARTSMLGPQQIADRIGDRFKLLTTGDRTAPVRQRTLLAAVQWSHDLLSGKERALLRRLSVFAGSFPLELAEQVCSDRTLPELEVLDLLGSLVDKSLVMCERGDGRARHRLLETIKQFAAERLRDEEEEERFRNRHLRVICELEERDHRIRLVAAGVPWPERLAAYVRARHLLDDQRAALDWAVESGEALLGLRLCRAMFSSWAIEDVWTESSHWFERLLKLDLADVPPGLVGMAKSLTAYAYVQGDDPSRALALVLEGLAEQRRGPYEYELCFAYAVVVTALLRTGQIDRAVPYVEEALALADEHGDAGPKALAMTGMASVSILRGRLREAQRWAEDALAAAEQSNHHWMVARTLSGLGAVAEARGDLDAAWLRYRAAIPLLEEFNSPIELARGLAIVGRVAALRGDVGAARGHLARSLELNRRSGQQTGLARNLSALAVLMETEGDLEGAVVAASASAALREAAGQRPSPGKLEELLDRARARLGEGRVTLLWGQGRELEADEVVRRVLAGELSLTSPRGSLSEVPGSPLTQREREIAALLTRGLSNKAVAEELVISPATVARHIANIMEKLGFTSRAQIAVYASEHELGSA